MLKITDTITLPDHELEFVFTRATGPGGQHVNRTESAVQVRFDVAGSTSLSDTVKTRLHKLAGRRISTEGILVIDAKRFRSQHKNRDDALQRLVVLIARAAVAPKKRRKTKPTRASRERRLAGKRQRSDTKRLRRKPNNQ